MKQYEVFELVFHGGEPEGSCAAVELEGEFILNGSSTAVKGFYAGDQTYKLRYYPREAGTCTWTVHSSIALEGDLCGEVECIEAGAGDHGMVQAEDLHFHYENGGRYLPFGTTVYALVHQEKVLVDQTMETLRKSPFNKVRMCVFPKSYDFNHNEPELFAFEKTNGKWDVNRPCFAFWDMLEQRVRELREMDIECDLILFHGYDRWGFSRFSEEEAMVYLNYLLRRLCAYPNLWWSMANEYEILEHFPKQWWYDFAQFIHENDPYGHLLSNHNFLQFWDFADKHITHCSIQDSNVVRVPEIQQEYQKPVVFDECCYEGNIMHPWGNLSGFELVNRFWTACVMGGYCTHGETFLSEDEVLWWAKGGILKGESPKRIAFLKSVLEELPGNLEYSKSLLETAYEKGGIRLPDDSWLENAMNMIGKELHEVSAVRAQGHFDKERVILGHCGEAAYLRYWGRQCAGQGELELPDTGAYDVEVIDVWEMTRIKVMEGVNGKVTVVLPGKEGIAVLAKLQ